MLSENLAGCTFPVYTIDKSANVEGGSDSLNANTHAANSMVKNILQADVRGKNAEWVGELISWSTTW